MKKIGKLLLVLACIIGIVLGGFCLLMKNQVKQMYAQLDAVGVVLLSDVADGTYEGTAETPLVKVAVAVTVEDHTLKNIQLLRH